MPDEQTLVRGLESINKTRAVRKVRAKREAGRMTVCGLVAGRLYIEIRRGEGVELRNCSGTLEQTLKRESDARLVKG